MATDDDLERRVFGLETHVVGTIKVLRELVQRMTLLTAAMQHPAAVEPADFDEIIGADPCVSPLLALSYVVWPTAALAAPPPPRLRQTPPETVERIFELAADGRLSHRELAERVGLARTTVTQILYRGRKRALERVA